MEISDLLMKGFGHAMMENIARDFYAGEQASLLQKVLDIFGMILYSSLHS